MPLLAGMSILLLCQLIGETLESLFHLPIPGSVIGMVILLIGLMVYGRVPEGLRITSNGLMRYLALLFIPAGVGVMDRWPLIRSNLLSITVTLVISTIALQAAIALFMRFMLKRQHLLEDHDIDPTLAGAAAIKQDKEDRS